MRQGLLAATGTVAVFSDADLSTPIETAIQGLVGLESTSTTSSTNSSLVSATFTYGTDLVKAESKITQAIARIKRTMKNRALKAFLN